MLLKEQTMLSTCYTPGQGLHMKGQGARHAS